MTIQGDTSAVFERESDLVRRLVELLSDRLPRGWAAEIASDEPNQPRGRADALVRLRSPDGASALLVIEAKRVLHARDVGWAREQLATAVAALADQDQSDTSEGLVPMVVARYLPPRTRERLRDLELNYVDATGNIEVALDSPALFVRDVGAQRDPWRGPGRPRGSYRGAAPARIVRALADFAPPMTIAELVERAGTSVGATYRMVELLERDDYIERKPRGPITRVAWRGMIERWSQDYGFSISNPAGSFLEPRGLPALVERLRKQRKLRYALTGSTAADYLASYAPARLAMIYVDELDRAVDELELRPAETGANVLLAAPTDDFVFERTRPIDGLQVAAPSQVAADLLTSPGRGPSEAGALLDWMETNEDAWRTRPDE